MLLREDMAFGAVFLLVQLPIFATPSFARPLLLELPAATMRAPSLEHRPRLDRPTPVVPAIHAPRLESNLALEAAMFGVGLFVVAPIAGDFAGRRSQAVIDDVTVYARTLTLSGAALAMAHQMFDPELVPRYMSSTAAALTAIAMGIGYQLELEWLAFGADVVLGGVVAAGALLAGEYYGGEILVECTEELAIGTLEKCLQQRPAPPVHVRFRSSEGGGLVSVRMSL